MKIFYSFLTLFLLTPFTSLASVINVPADVGTIKGAVEVAVDGDEVIVSSGIYVENRIKVDKNIIIRGKGGKETKQTIIKGSNNTVFDTYNEGGVVTISYLTFTDCYKPIVLHGESYISNNVFYDNNSDIISFEEEGYGSVVNNVIEGAGDDGIDVDGEMGYYTIRGNHIINSDDDGIEIRLHSVSNTELIKYTIKDNVIVGSGEDAIQLIDYNDNTPSRVFKIYRNVLMNSKMVGVGCMAGEETRENYAGSMMQEELFLYNNIIMGNYVGVTGAPGMKLYDNVIGKNTNGNIKNANGAEIRYNILY